MAISNDHRLCCSAEDFTATFDTRLVEPKLDFTFLTFQLLLEKADGPITNMSQSLGRNSPRGLPSPQTKEGIYTALERLAKAIQEACNAENHTDIREHWTNKYLADDYCAEPAYRAGASTREENLQLLHELLQRHPQYHATVTQTTGHVNMKAGYAEVYLHVIVRGMPEGVVRQSVGVHEFRLRNDRWFCTKYTAMRGHPSMHMHQSENEDAETNT